jgi:serine/threonine protein kinase
VLGRALGQGGFGITYIGWDLFLARKLAIKEYLPSGVATRRSGDTTVTPYSAQIRPDYEWGLDKFIEEARVLARFQNHPCIVSVTNFFRANGTAYLVMEFLEGRSFEDYLNQRGGSIPFVDTLRIMMPVMDALREVHAAGILHRDISPDNIYLCHSGQVKVIDFGAARAALGQHSQALSVIVKAGYAPEEQYRSKGKQGPWSDVYATAATMYRAITGNMPPPSPDRQAEDELLPPSVLGVSMHRNAEAALLKGLAVRATDRFQSMGEFQEALTGAAPAQVTAVPQALKAPAPSTSSPQVPPAPARAVRVPKWAIGAAAAVALLLVVFMLRPDDDSKPEASALKNAAVSPTSAAGRPESGSPSTASTAKSATAPARQMPSKDNTASSSVPPRNPNDTPLSSPAAVQGQHDAMFQGAWQASVNNGPPCAVDLQSNGAFAVAAAAECGPLSGERGMWHAANGKWRLLSSSVGRIDHGTYKVVSPGRVEVIGLYGTAVYTRRSQASALPQPPHAIPSDPSRQVQPVSADADYRSLIAQAGRALNGRNAHQAEMLLQKAISLDAGEPQAHEMLGHIYLYSMQNPGQAGAAMREAIQRGGAATFRVRHDHFDGSFVQSCTGVLKVGRTGVSFTADDGGDRLSTSHAEIREIARNRMNVVGGAVEGIASGVSGLLRRKDRARVQTPARGSDVPSFHLKTSSRNYNFAPTSTHPQEELDLILSLARR